jgi:N-acetylglucosaminyl-diphospho-decaprenol L-rhamnosyltransferase
VSSVSAVIGNYNGAHLLRDCVASLAGQSLAPQSILVVDGASSDRSESLTHELGATFVAEDNNGLGYLYNRGVDRTETDYVFLGNNDIALLPDCLEQLAAALDASPNAFAADARQLDWSGERTIHAQTTLTPGALFREHLPGLHLDHNVRASAITPTVCANGASMMIRREVFEELGGFDETFFMEWEDLDLCWRGWDRGWSTLYVPDAVVRHHVGAVTSAQVRPRRAASSHHNLMRFALKCLPAAATARVVVGELLRMPAHPRAILAGAAAVISEAAEIRRFRLANPPARALLASMFELHSAALSPPPDA